MAPIPSTEQATGARTIGTRARMKGAMIRELGGVPVVADALDPGQVADAPGRARQDVATNDGETRTRTGDTTIFSRVLYQLSYLAVGGTG